MLRYRPRESRPVSCIHEMLKTTTVRLLHADLSMLSFKEQPALPRAVFARVDRSGSENGGNLYEHDNDSG